MTFAANLLQNRNAFVAGGTSGINLGIAHALAAAGANVAVLSRSAEKVAAAREALAAHGTKIEGYAADVRDCAAVKSAFAGAHAALGPLDIVISGAAGNFVAPAVGLSSNGFRAVMEIDLLGTFHVLRSAYEVARKPGCVMINISAPQSTLPFWGQCHVSAAKAGVDMLTRSLALEWGPEGLRVNAIVPGPIDETEGMARLAPTPEMRAQAARAVPLGMFGAVTDIANLALFLASPAARYITGAIIPCDGGQLLTGAGVFSPQGFLG